jgi:hypothetical protein
MKIALSVMPKTSAAGWKRDRAQRGASGSPSRSRHNGGHRPVRCHQSVAPSLGFELSPVNVRDPGEIERGITAFARSSNGGLIVTASALASVHRDLIAALAARHKLPAVYYERSFVNAGGPDLVWA